MTREWQPRSEFLRIRISVNLREERVNTESNLVSIWAAGFEHSSPALGLDGECGFIGCLEWDVHEAFGLEEQRHVG